MRNRAKCKLCNDILESKHRHDYVTCSCGEVSIDGGQDYFRARFNDKVNFACIDDDGNEIVPAEKEGDTEPGEVAKILAPKPPKATKKELVGMLSEMVSRIENLPQDALYAPMTHADFCSLLIILRAILESE